MKEIDSINVMEYFSLYNKQWTLHIIGELNGQYVKLCKLKDDFSDIVFWGFHLLQY